MIGFYRFILIAIATSVGVFGNIQHSRAEMARWNVDLDHSTVGFQVTHMVISQTTGKFTDYQGFIEMDPEAKKVNAIEAVIETKSLFTDHPKRDEHLLSPDFFDVEKFPTMTYKMKSYKKTGDTYTAIGNLTLRGVTKEITLVGTFNGTTKDPWGNTRAGFTATGTLNRQDFGMTFSQTLDNGGLLVGNEVNIKLDIECIKEKHPTNEPVKHSKSKKGKEG